MLSRVTRLLVSLAVVVLFFALTASAQNEVSVGTDYLYTGPGTFFDLSARGFSTSVAFKSNPSTLYCMDITSNGSQNCTEDTIIQRQQDGPIDGETAVPIQIVYLSLCSANTAGGSMPATCYQVLNNNGFLYKIYATLDPRALPNDTGTITFSGDENGGTISASFTVNLLATFTPTNGGPPLSPFRASFTVCSGTSASCPGGTPAAWTSTEPPSPPYFSITAPYPAQQANVNTNPPRRPQIVIKNFFPVTFIRELHFGRGVCHVASLGCSFGGVFIFPPPFVLFWLVCVFFFNNNLSLNQVADLMLPPADFGAMSTQNAAWDAPWDKVEEPVTRKPLAGVSGADKLPRAATAAARN